MMRGRSTLLVRTSVKQAEGRANGQDSISIGWLIMTPTIRLGKLFGIEVGFNWSLVVIFVLVAWTLASSVLPTAVPGEPALAYWLTGLAGAVVFFVCLLVHELAHAIAARRQGVRVGGITLWLFGGVSQLTGEPPNAGAEALIIGAGPLASLGIA